MAKFLRRTGEDTCLNLGGRRYPAPRDCRLGPLGSAIYPMGLLAEAKRMSGFEVIEDIETAEEPPPESEHEAVPEPTPEPEPTPPDEVVVDDDNEGGSSNAVVLTDGEEEDN